MSLISINKQLVSNYWRGVKRTFYILFFLGGCFYCDHRAEKKANEECQKKIIAIEEKIASEQNNQINIHNQKIQELRKSKKKIIRNYEETDNSDIDMSLDDELFLEMQ